MRREEAAPCPGRSDLQHVWIEITNLSPDMDKATRFQCGYCPAEAFELTPRGLAEQLGARPADIPGLWFLQGYPELTTHQLIDVARQRGL